MECEFCGNKIEKDDPLKTVCESCFDTINLEEDTGQFIGYEKNDMK